MVPDTLIRVLLSFVAIVLLGLCVSKGCRPGDLHVGHEARGHVHEIREEASEADGDSFVLPTRRVLGSLERLRLENACAEIWAAFSNRQFEVISRHAESLPKMAEVAMERDLQGVRSLSGVLIYGILYRRTGPSLRAMQTRVELCAQVRSEFELLRVFGNICLSRHEYPGMLGEMESRMLVRLAEEKKALENLGEMEAVGVLAGLEDEWKRRIESAHGFTRACVERAVARAKKFGYRDMKETGESWEKVLQCYVLQACEPLVRVGYTPAWLEHYMTAGRHSPTRNHGNGR